MTVTDYTHLLPYLALLIGIIALPGMDMAFILGKTLSGGGRLGAAALAGIIAGGVVHTAMAATGVAAVLTLFPALFNAMLICGAIYMLWIAGQIARHRPTLTEMPALPHSSAARTFLQGVITCLINPKAWLFMFAVFPQFIRPAFGPIAAQAIVMGAMTAGVQLVVYGLVVLAGRQARVALATSGPRQILMGRGVAVALAFIAVWSVWRGWRAL